MKVIDHINESKKALISFEILPPLKGKGIHSLYRHLDPLMEYKPAFINVTYHRSEHVFKKTAAGTFEKVVAAQVFQDRVRDSDFHSAGGIRASGSIAGLPQSA